jgi:type IV pilus assembly protein PilA
MEGCDKMPSKLRSKIGFTLIELMVVVAIIGILASIAIPNFLRFQAKSKQSEARLLLSGIFTAQTSFFSENNRYGSFNEIAWTPIGTKQIYTYYSGSDGLGGSGLTDFKDPPAPAVHSPWTGSPVPAQSTGVVTGFTSGAVGNIDSDATLDAWIINDQRNLACISDDVTS